MNRLLFFVVCYFAGQVAASELNDSTFFIQKRHDQFRATDMRSLKKTLIRRSGTNRPRQTSPPPSRGSISPKQGSSNAPSRASSADLGVTPSPKGSSAGTSPRYKLGSSMGNLIPPLMRSPPAPRRLMLGRKPSQVRLGNSPRKPPSQSSLASSSQGQIHRSGSSSERMDRLSLGSLGSLPALLESGTFATAGAVGKGPATLRKQQGDGEGRQAPLAKSETGSFTAAHPDHVWIGGTAGRSRSPSPGRSPSPPREKAQVEGHARADFVNVELDLRRGGKGCITDCGGTDTKYKNADLQKFEGIPGQKSTMLYKGSTDGTPAHIKTRIEEPASFDMLGKMIPQGEDRKTWLDSV